MTCRFADTAEFTDTLEIVAFEGDEVVVLHTPRVLRPLSNQPADAAVVREPMLMLRFDADRADYQLGVTSLG